MDSSPGSEPSSCRIVKITHQPSPITIGELVGMLEEVYTNVKKRRNECKRVENVI